MEPAGPSVTSEPPAPPSYGQVQASAEFARLRRSYRSFAFPVTVAFIAWYLLYVLLSSFAEGFMGARLFGTVNVALVLGLAQFLTTFLIAWLYSRYAKAKLDDEAAALKARLENSPAPDTATAGATTETGGGK